MARLIINSCHRTKQTIISLSTKQILTILRAKEIPKYKDCNVDS